jgi:YVTN family beta-propeller protein
MTHKDVGKVTRIDTQTLDVKEVIDTGFITNHLSFAKTALGTLAYVTIGGENVVKVYSTGSPAKLITTIPTGALPHGVWTSDDNSHVYVGLENGDGVDVIETATNHVTAHIPVGQAPQALVYVSNAVPQGDGKSNLVPRVNSDSLNIALKATSGNAKGFIVSRSLGVVDAFEVSRFKLKPQTVYSVYVSGQKLPVARFTTNAAGVANGTAIGPMRQVANGQSANDVTVSTIIVMEGDADADQDRAVLVSAK